MRESFVSVRRWPRAKKYFGIAHGWPGAAWVALEFDRCGLIPVNKPVLAGIANRLNSRKKIRFEGSICTSHLIGSGSYAVIAAKSASRGDVSFRQMRETIAAWVRDCDEPGETDVMLGSAGALLACAEIERILPGHVSAQFVKRLHGRVNDALRDALSAQNHQPVYLGLSHGVAGYLLALEMTEAVFGLRWKHALRVKCFDVIAENRLSIGDNAMVWPQFAGEQIVFRHSWCHGAPGIGLALLCAYKLTDFDAYREIAEQALRGTFRYKSEPPNFCCGSAGRAQILIEAFRLTGNPGWLKKAKQVAAGIRFPKAKSPYNRGFHGGRLGYDYLLWRLKHPRSLSLPALGLFSSSNL